MTKDKPNKRNKKSDFLRSLLNGWEENIKDSKLKYRHFI
jgi:hypothetical protein